MLTAKEFDLLALLIRNPGRVFTFEMIMDLVWNEEDSFYSRKVIINHASNLRKKLRISDAVPDYIKSIRGIGYKFDSDCRGTTSTDDYGCVSVISGTHFFCFNVSGYGRICGHNDCIKAVPRQRLGVRSV